MEHNKTIAITSFLASATIACCPELVGIGDQWRILGAIIALAALGLVILERRDF